MSFPQQNDQTWSFYGAMAYFKVKLSVLAKSACTYMNFSLPSNFYAGDHSQMHPCCHSISSRHNSITITLLLLIHEHIRILYKYTHNCIKQQQCDGKTRKSFLKRFQQHATIAPHSHFNIAKTLSNTQSEYRCQERYFFIYLLL